MTVTVARQAKQKFDAALTLSGMPSGITGSFSPSIVSFPNGGGTAADKRQSVLTVNVNASVHYGSYTFTITATQTTNSSDNASVTVTLFVGAPQTQTISFAAISDMRYGDPSVSL